MDIKPTLVVAWFGAAITTFIFSLSLLFYLSFDRVVLMRDVNLKLYAALPASSIKMDQAIGKKDARSKIIENFFKSYKSPLAKFSGNFVSAADKYKLDYRWLPAISMQESNGGLKVIKDSKNPFGYGIYGGQVLKFSSWEESIEKVAKKLKEDYFDQGLKTPVQIMAKYTPPSVSKGGTWAKGVSSFMEELR